MAFSGYLIAFTDNSNNLIKFPNKYIRFESYEIAPNQRLDLDSTRDTTGVLHRNVLAHTATKVSFNMPAMNNTELQNALTYFTNAWGYNTGDTQARKCKVTYWNEMKNTYESMICYMPDIKFTIWNLDENTNVINYGETKISFIEY